MKKEVVVTAKTIDLAVGLGAQMLERERSDVSFDVIDMPKKGFLGFGDKDAKVRVYYIKSAADIAVTFVKNIIKHMNVNAHIEIKSETEKNISLNIRGENVGILIGYHGDMLDAMQYLTFLAVNKELDLSEESDAAKDEASVRVSLDVENYREKREETLRNLAARKADRVLKFGKPITLEPMNSYERRIIHAAIQDIAGVTTHSVGQDNARRIVITREGERPPVYPRFNSTTQRKPPFDKTTPRPFQSDRINTRPFYRNPNESDEKVKPNE